MSIKVEDPYAKYYELPKLTYRIIEILMKSEDAEELWKSLKYDEPDAWNKPNLTMEEKAALIYPGGEHQEDYHVFMDFTMDDAVYKESTYLRIYPLELIPTNRTVGICSINFEVFTHSKLNHLSNYTTRIDDIIQILLRVLNGAEISNMGCLFFDASRSRNNEIVSVGMKPYKGKMMTMSLNIG